MVNIRLKNIILISSVLMVITGISLAWMVQTSFGNVNTTEINLLTDEDVLIHCTLQVPSYASGSNQLPGVVIIHGSMQSKEWLSAFSIELSRRGFVTLSIDAAGHGNSGYADYGNDRGSIVALEYLQEQTYVSNIGMVGHSMGAGICIDAINRSSVEVDALVLVGGGSGGDWANTTYPSNLLITVGKYDELFNIGSLKTSLMNATGSSDPVISGQLYGDYSTGTARKLVIGPSNHVYETVDPVIIGETTEWMMNSLKLGEDQYWLPKGDMIYPMHILGGFISSLGILISILPLTAILLELTPFNRIKALPESTYVAEKRSYWFFGMLYAVIGLGSFVPAMFLGRYLPFPQNTGSMIVVWLLGITASATLVLLVYRYFRKREVSIAEFGFDRHFNKNNITNLLLGLVIALVTVFWIYIWTFIVDELLVLDFRVFFPLFNDLTMKRFLIVPLYLVFTVPFFFVEGIWLMGFLRTEKVDNFIEKPQKWVLKAVFIKCIPFIVIIAIQTVISVIIGGSFISGMIGFYLLFLWMFTPAFAITTIILAWSYRLTGKIYIGVFLNSLLFSWILATILSLSA